MSPAAPARRRRHRPDTRSLAIPTEASVLDVLDSLLNKGVVTAGDVMLGVAGVDLIYLRLSTLLCAIDRLKPRRSHGARRSTRDRARKRRT